MPTYTITADQLASIKASHLQHLDNGDVAAADALGWVLAAESSGCAEFSVIQSDMEVANVSGPREQALRDAIAYAHGYSNEGVVELYEVQRMLVLTMQSATQPPET